MTIIRKSAGAALILAISLASACLIVLDDTGGGSGARRELHRLIPFASGGTLSLRHLDGDVEIRGWDRAEVEITAESEAGGEGVRLWPAGRGGGHPRFEIEEAAGRLTVRTRWEGDDRAVYPVHLFLSVPRAMTVEDAATQIGNVLIADLYGKAKVSILEGDLTVENFSGSLEATVGRGNVRAEILDLRKEDAVRLTARAGDIGLLLEPAAAARVDAEASAGIVGDWAPAGAPKKADVKIGGGAAAVVLRAPAGRIELIKIR